MTGGFPAWYRGKEEQCSTCGRLYPRVIMIRQGGQPVCPDCADEAPVAKDDES